MSDANYFLHLVGPDEPAIDVHPGEVLFEKGDHAYAMYVVKAGQLEIFDGGTVFETVGPGQIVGEMAMIDDVPRGAAVRATTECKLIAIDRDRFITMVERTPTFSIRVMRVLANRLRALHEAQLRLLAQKK
jgi:CRP/FNR family transcriptional regulator, cyclic AMP receptor protein